MVLDCRTKLVKSEKKEPRVAAARKMKKRTETRGVEVEETSTESEDSGKE